MSKHPKQINKALAILSITLSLISPITVFIAPASAYSVIEPNQRSPSPTNSDLFGSFKVYASGSWPEAIATGEWNGDDKMDVILATSFDFDATNDNQGHFFAQTAPDALTRTSRVESGNSPTALARGDFNYDGQDDLAVINQGENTLGIFLQTNGALGSMSIINTEASPDGIAVGDFNGDLRDDVAVSHASSPKIAIYHQQTAGSFTTPVFHEVQSGGFNALASGDLNSDGYDDLVLLRGAGASQDQVAIFHQQYGKLAAPIFRTVQDHDFQAYGLAVGDVTGDGRDDIVVSAGANSSQANLNILSQQTDGTLAATPTTYTAYHLPKAVAIGDVNHDGRNDVVVAHAAWQSLSVYLQSNTGVLNDYESYKLPYTDNYRPGALALADMSGNGALDVLLAHRSSIATENGLVMLSNTSQAPFANITSPQLGQRLTETTTLTIEGSTTANATQLEISTDGGQTWQSQTASRNWSYNWSVPDKNGSYLILARAIDNTGQVQSPPARIKMIVGEDEPPPTTSIELLPGWNLISLPKHPNDTAIANTFASIAGNYDLAYAYDGCNAALPWQKYDPNGPPFANTLTEVNETMGFWINMTTADTLEFEGAEITSTTIPLCTGWNLVGYPASQAQGLPNVLSPIGGGYNLVYGYDGSNAATAWKKFDPNAPPFANTLSQLEPGYGYWIDASQDGELVISHP